MTIDTISGMFPPADKNVIPIIESGIPRVSPTTVVIQETKYEDIAIHITHIKNVAGYQLRNLLYLVSGIVMNKSIRIGHVIRNQNFNNGPPLGHINKVSATIMFSLDFIYQKKFIFRKRILRDILFIEDILRIS